MPIPKSFLKYALIFLVAASAAAYIRLYPLWGHIWAPTNEQATLAVIFNLKKTLLEQVHQQFPQMPPPEAEVLVSQKTNEILRTDGDHVRRVIEQARMQMAEQNNNGKSPVYLLEADPFYYYGLTQNILEHGRMAETVKGNKYFNPLMGAPFGYWQPFTIHPYSGVLLYKAVSLVHPNPDLMAVVAWVPILITVLCIAAFIWCGYLLAFSPLAITVGSFYFALAPIFIKRSAMGWYDTDPYNVLFALLFLGIIFKSIAAQAVRFAPLSAAILAGMLIFYSLIWQGWVFLFFMALISVAALAGHAWIVLRDRKQALAHLLWGGLFLGVTVVAGCCIYGPVDFISFFSEGAGELKKFTVKGMSLWPNLFLEVGELKKSSVAELMSDTGGPIFLLGAALGLVFALWQAFKNIRGDAAKRYMIVAIFLLITVVMTLKALRFALFALVPMALFFTLAVDQILRWSTGWAIGWATGWPMNGLARRIASTLQGWPHARILPWILATLLVALAWSGGNRSVRTVLTPIYNSAWDQSMRAIKANTPPDSIVNTWWPPGHFIKGVAHRHVPFDGASLSEGATGYWIANILLSTDEDRARGLLRMLNTSGNQAVEFLNTHGMTTSQAVALLNVIATQNVADASRVLRPLLKTDANVHALLKLTHEGSPHSYLLIYNEMVDENIGLVFTARRNIARIEAINADPNLLSRVPSPDSPEFIDFLWGLSGGPTKFSEPLSVLGRDGNNLIFQDGISVAVDMSSAAVKSPKYGAGTPLVLIGRRDGHVIERELAGGNLNYAVVVYEQDGQPMCRLMDRSLAESMLVRLYFFDGDGLKNFELLNKASDLTGRTQIKVFKALWD